MRVLLSNKSRKNLVNLFKTKYNAKSIKELSNRLNVPVKTLDSWFYKKERYIPQKIIEEWVDQLEILDRKEDKWGAIKGGKISYIQTIKKFGKEEVKRRQALGGKTAAIIKDKKEKSKFSVDIQDPSFLEFYGILLGDGWLSNFKAGNKRVWIIGVSTNLKLERKFLEYYSSIVNKRFNRKGTIREKPVGNVIEFIFSHKYLLKYFNEALGFPIGKKENLEINKIIYDLDFSRLKYVIRGIFDTDGSFYLDKNRRKKNYYPIISIHMKEPKLIKQINDILKNNGFSVNYDEKNNMIKLKGHSQLKKWLSEIGSSNPYKLIKMKRASQQSFYSPNSRK